jgi:hypothetical protein
VYKRQDPHCTATDKLKSSGIKVVIGHCIQSESTMANQPSMTFIDTKDDEYINENRTQTTLGNNIYYGPPKLIHPRSGTHYNPVIFGITTDCVTMGHNTIYRVDVGSSRGFDRKSHAEHLNNANFSDKVEIINSLYLSRTPQALRIQPSQNVTAITKSKFVNTVHNIPRPDLNSILSTLNTQGPQGIVNILETYDKKYRKYKSKYLSK